MPRLGAVALLISMTAGLVGCAVAPLNTGDFVRELIDLRRLAEFPSPAYKTVQFSSYDRRSNLAGGPGWFANADGFGGEPIPGFEGTVKAPGGDGVGEYLICDVRGPGVIVRTWTAGMAGKIRLFLDDSSRPVYDGAAEAFLLSPYRVLCEKSGTPPPLDGDLLRQQQASYCPIPFGRRCRMTWVGSIKELHFYHVQIRCYEGGTTIRTFTPVDPRRFAPQVRQAARILADPEHEYGFASARAAVGIHAAVKPGEQVEALRLDGPLAVERLTLKVEGADAALALRQTILNIICDEHSCAQVQAPIGDFFGAAPGINPFNSLPFTVSPEGTMACRYLMPFAKSLRLVLDNRGQQPVTVTGSALPLEYQWTERSMHFRARWRVNHGLTGSPRAVRDMPFLMAHGQGRYVGTALMLLNPCRVPTPGGGWWGEGDEKVFVDDDRMPSIFGTGSEDYFNYAWSVPDIFCHAYAGQPRNDGYGNRGFVANYRWQIVDDLPFRQFLSFALELYPHDVVPGMSYARIGYYYARPGAIDDHVAITDEDVRAVELPATWTPAATHAMNGAVYYEAEDIVQPGPRATPVADRLRTGGQMLVWCPTAVGDALTLRLSVKEAGKYCLHLGLALNGTSGRISTKLDGAPVTWGGPSGVIDLHVPYRVLARQFSSPVLELTEGAHDLGIVFEGAPSGVSTPEIGIDYVAIQRR